MILRRLTIPNQTRARLAHTYTRPRQVLPQALVMLQKPAELELGHGLLRTGRHGGVVCLMSGVRVDFLALFGVGVKSVNRASSVLRVATWRGGIAIA